MRSRRSSRSCCSSTPGPIHVIASEAKQSISPHKEGMDCFVACAPRNDGYRLVMPREGGASSTLRLIDSIIDVSGILDHPPSRVMTTKYVSAFSRLNEPEVCLSLVPQTRGRREDRVLAAPAVPRAICANKTAHEHTGQRQHSGLPCARKSTVLKSRDKSTASD
jgi:hypothetical protein